MKENWRRTDNNCLELWQPSPQTRPQPLGKAHTAVQPPVTINLAFPAEPCDAVDHKLQKETCGDYEESCDGAVKQVGETEHICCTTLIDELKHVTKHFDNLSETDSCESVTLGEGGPISGDRSTYSWHLLVRIRDFLELSLNSLMFYGGAGNVDDLFLQWGV